jgi:hypothetical protein
VCYQEKKKDANDDSADATNPVGEPAGLEVDPKSIDNFSACQLKMSSQIWLAQLDTPLLTLA